MKKRMENPENNIPQGNQPRPACPTLQAYNASGHHG
jgi:hypothetical protein